MTKRFVIVAGNTGAGKTSISERIAARLDWRAACASVAYTPYLAEFCADMRQWSFHSKPSSTSGSRASTCVRC